MTSLTRILPKGLPPTFAALALLSMAIGGVVLIAALTLLAVPLVIVLGLVVASIAGVLLGGWALIEAMAALERWMERDTRFQR
ncbi:MAG: Uncharacterised protein [Prochlorococcus marinus str. MIT 9215]|nr:MAG: Uncharacterised protein [Prochlorococcus marinus str. MIT 9215]